MSMLHCLFRCELTFENFHKTEEGMNVPEVLQPFMGGKKFIPFVNPKPGDDKKKGK